MKLRRIEIENFGMFSSQEFEFGGGFDVVFGPNEAGKSTLLQLIRELFFGFPLRNRYAFEDHSGELAATADIEMADGTAARFRRRKGRNNPVEGRLGSPPRDIDAAGLDRLLGGANAELYEHVFGISLAELAAGEESLKHANLNEALYGGGLGGLANFKNVQADLQSEAGSLFAPTATKRTINRLLTDIRKCAKQLREATVKPRDYKQLAKCHAESAQEVERLRGELVDLRSREAHLQRLSDALDPWLEMMAAEDEFSRLDAPASFPNDAAARYEQLTQRRGELCDELAGMREDLAAASDALDNILLKPDLIEHESDIKRLQQRLSEISGFRRDVPLRGQESETIRTSVLARLRELNPDWDFKQLDEYHTGLEQRDAVDRLKEEKDELESREQETRARRDTLDQDLRETRDQLDDLGAGEPPAALERLLASASRYESDAEKLAELRESAAEMQFEIESLVRRLCAPLDVSLEADRELPVPLEATVVEFRDRLLAAHDKQRRARERIQQNEAELEQVRDDLAQLDAGITVASREQLTAQRLRRDQLWRLVRRRYVDQEPVANDELSPWKANVGDLPDQYQREVAAADQFADQRQEQAEVAARRDQLAVKMGRLEKHLSAAQAKGEKASEEVQQAERAWRAVWRNCPFEPQSPAAMLDWLREYAQLGKRRDEARLLANRIDQQQQDVEQFEQQVREAFDQADETIDSLMGQARKLVDTSRATAAQRTTYEKQLRSKAKQLGQLNGELAALADRKNDWHERWTQLLNKLGFPKHWDASLATKILSGLSAARSEYEKAESLDTRVEGMNAGVRQFERQVDKLCQDLAPDLCQLPAEDAAVQLNERLDAAKQADRDQEKFAGDKTKLTRRVNQKQTQLASVNEALEQLMTAAGAASEQEFLQIAERARRRSELNAAISAARGQIRTIRRTEDEAEFVAELKQADADSLAAQQRQLQHEISAAQQSYDDALESVTRESDRLKEMESATLAADLALQLEVARGQLATAVDRWAPLVLAQTLMRRAVERFERERQPAMLGTVRQLFEQMTDGRYVGIERKLDQRGTLQAVDRRGQKKEAHQLSVGTREQLYLAIRLAYIEHYCRDSEPLPVVMDDVLVNFDQLRVRNTLQMLATFSGHVQVIFLTCHEHMLSLIREVDQQVEPIVLPAAESVAAAQPLPVRAK